MLSTVACLEPDSILSLLASPSKGTSATSVKVLIWGRQKREPEQEREREKSYSGKTKASISQCAQIAVETAREGVALTSAINTHISCSLERKYHAKNWLKEQEAESQVDIIHL